jgi:four helix bundle protein
MEKNAYARHFSELVTWKMSRELAEEIFEASKSFPEEERFSLTDQIRRASRSVGAQIAEAWAKRRYEKHFVSKLTDADGEQNENQHWLIVAMDSGYLDKETVSRFGTRCKEIGAMIGKMISIADRFCGNPEPPPTTKVRESDDTTEFFILPSDLDQEPITDY